MIIELERGRQSTLDQIRDLAVRFGNRIELSEGTGVFDTILVIGDNREFAARIDFIRGLPGVQAAWEASAGYNNIARVVRSRDGRAVQRERRIVEVRGLDGKAASAPASTSLSAAPTRRRRSSRRWPTPAWRAPSARSSACSTA